MIKSKAELKIYIQRDTERLFPKGVSILTKMRDPIYIYQKTLRKCEYYRNTSKVSPYLNPLYILHKYRLRKYSFRLGFSISENVFGPGLSIAHFGSIIVNPNVVVGENCRIHSGVNIGANRDEFDVPTIGDNVYIGPGAKIFGKITIGNGCRIGANAVVNKSFPDKCIIVGIPAESKREL